MARSRDGTPSRRNGCRIRSIAATISDGGVVIVRRDAAVSRQAICQLMKRPSRIPCGLTPSSRSTGRSTGAPSAKSAWRQNRSAMTGVMGRSSAKSRETPMPARTAPPARTAVMRSAPTPLAAKTPALRTNTARIFTRGSSRWSAVSRTRYPAGWIIAPAPCRRAAFRGYGRRSRGRPPSA